MNPLTQRPGAPKTTAVCVGVTFHACEVVDHLDPEEADYRKLAEPIARRQALFQSALPYSSSQFRLASYPVSWNNLENDAVMVLTPESFRPNIPWESNRDDCVLVSRDPDADSIKVSWELTEDGSDATTTGELQVEPDRLVMAPDLFKGTFSRAE